MIKSKSFIVPKTSEANQQFQIKISQITVFTPSVTGSAFKSADGGIPPIPSPSQPQLIANKYCAFNALTNTTNPETVKRGCCNPCTGRPTAP